MKQVLQSLTSGKILVEEVPPPTVEPGFLVIKSHGSAVSVGTERATIERVRQGVLGAAMAQPELVKDLFRSLSTEGLGPTLEKVQARLEKPLCLGYSSAGVVQEVGEGAEGFQVGDPVACAGYGYASHAEWICVPKNLCAKIPPGVSWEEASFTTMGAIALQAVRVADLRIGESVAVIGLGIIGQLVVQAARAAGCRVFALDPRPERVAVAQELGAEGGSSSAEREVLTRAGEKFTGGHGFDAVLLAAAARDEEPLTLAGELAKEKGCVVVLGDVPLKAPRKRFYEKELQLRLARSYGPGRYDPAYERHGLDYPFGYVRWTAQRNMDSFLQLMAAGKVKVSPLITHRFPVDQAEKAYGLILDGRENSLGVLFQYETAPAMQAGSLHPREPRKVPPPPPGTIGIGVIGAGRFSGGQLLPRLKKMPGVHLAGISTAHGATAQAAGRHFGISFCTTDYRDLLRDPSIQAVLIATPHDLHARMVMAALRAGRHTFVEKPLCLREEELIEIVQTYESLEIKPVLSVGFNRRFSWAARWVAGWLKERRNPLTLTYRINAGPLPKEGWLGDPMISGGRVLGEMGHFIDLAAFFVGAAPIQVSTCAPQLSAGQPGQESLTADFTFPDGSLATIAYLTNGDRSCPKERIELFSEGETVIIDDFRSLTAYRKGRKSALRRWVTEKGFQAELAAFIRAIRSGGPSPVPASELFSITLATLKILESLRLQRPVPVQLPADASR